MWEFNYVFFNYSSTRLEVRPCSPTELQEKPPADKLGFGQVMTDHMLTCKWTQGEGWDRPVIEKVKPLQLHPAAKVRRIDK